MGMAMPPLIYKAGEDMTQAHADSENEGHTDGAGMWGGTHAPGDHPRQAEWAVVFTWLMTAPAVGGVCSIQHLIYTRKWLGRGRSWARIGAGCIAILREYELRTYSHLELKSEKMMTRETPDQRGSVGFELWWCIWRIGHKRSLSCSSYSSVPQMSV